MKINYIEEEFSTKSYFLDESVFEPEYCPKRLLHRENELILLSKIFLPVIKHPNSISKKVIVTGSIGVGKTVTLKMFAEMLKESANLRQIKLNVIHINCRSNRTAYMILKSILDSLSIRVPMRGLSPSELLSYLTEFLARERTHLILVLDELNFITKKDSDLIYTLSRINEMMQLEENFISIIGIVKDLVMLNNLDDATLSTLQSEILKFKKYSKSQIYDILNDRILKGLRPGIISEDIINVIAENASETGDMRMALKLVKSSVIYTETHQLEQVNLEAIRIANAEFFPLSMQELQDLNLHELIILKVICDLLMKKNRSLFLTEIKEEYQINCNMLGISYRSNTQIWEYIQNLRKFELIETRIINRDIKGRKLAVDMPNYSVSKIKQEVSELIKTVRE